MLNDIFAVVRYFCVCHARIERFATAGGPLRQAWYETIAIRFVRKMELSALALFPDVLREPVSTSRALLIGAFGDDYNLVIETASVLKRAGRGLRQP